ncbi:hypothetical protein CDAR_80751 [Caerostris darwini]|uniref:Uncharacterized protein n=1 Tax=Caerostris darwini TaxID=1538125 RepID=A0AAV4QB15_9ARAC|nr:hypothetical protein CDAR_80751 [Caerostris darwini]
MNPEHLPAKNDVSFGVILSPGSSRSVLRTESCLLLFKVAETCPDKEEGTSDKLSGGSFPCKLIRGSSLKVFSENKAISSSSICELFTAYNSVPQIYAGLEYMPRN